MILVIWWQQFEFTNLQKRHFWLILEKLIFPDIMIHSKLCSILKLYFHMAHTIGATKVSKINELENVKILNDILSGGGTSTKSCFTKSELADR